MSRRGVEISSFTLHPAGIPHGPHPGTVEASIGKEATEELAVMIDTFRPLRITRQAAALDDDRYPYSGCPTPTRPARPKHSPSAVRRRSRTERVRLVRRSGGPGHHGVGLGESDQVTPPR